MKVRTLKEALEIRGVDTSKLTSGATVLDWLVDDTGQKISEDPIPQILPERVIGFTRVGFTGRNRDEPFRMNSGVALDPSHTRIMWLG